MGQKLIQVPSIVVDSIMKSYDGKEALRGISFEVDDGEVFGFLGPNGAGKTTAIKILTTLIPPSSGTATVLGYDIKSSPYDIKKRIGVVQQQESYELNISVERSLDLYGLLWNVPKQRRKILIEELLGKFDLADHRKVKTSDLSIGLRRRLQVAREFMHDMELIFLDEPTVGLDAIARRSALDFFKEKARQGLTIFFTTHILDEAEYLCDRIALINNGRIVVVDSPANIKRQFGKKKTVELKVKQVFPGDFRSKLQNIEGIEHISFTDDKTVSIVTSSPEDVMSRILRITEASGLEVSSIYLAEPSLEEVFISIIKEDHR